MTQPTRIVTRPDFDGVVCASLISDAEKTTEPVVWASPNDMQRALVPIGRGDIIANLPYHQNCRMWFDHHYSNQIRGEFEGIFRIAPSAAGLVYEYFRDRLSRDYTTLVAQTDKIDSANLSLEEILHPERFPYIFLSMTIHERVPTEDAYCNHLVDLLQRDDIEDIMNDDRVRQRTRTVAEENQRYRKLLARYTQIRQHVAITDFRAFDTMPEGNRFLVYSMFPQSVVHVKIGYKDARRQTVIIKVGHSIINRNCRINVGRMLSFFEGGGHRGAGATRFDVSKAATYIPRIIDILLANDPEKSVVDKSNRRQEDRRSGKDRRQKDAAAYLAGRGVERRSATDRRTAVHEPRKAWQRIGRWKSARVLPDDR